ncbi:precorrin-3B C17-methyltransferase [Melghirimyces profundicolus]|uniref:Precorrin-3B C17-methyltransferase n=1 Tax=Melghirimyces profundicolus TaxID=1242148 RepID=A0A2T6C8C9_9BACL|nr:precorrin-3B C(17)-methyltransferase [Melghirimyces profundicolus]PTX64568.1 precorrin-3B C17-methyltransferase [Melghirimyces profundicolus]
MSQRGGIRIIGLGPGDPGLMTPRASEALEGAEVVIGYRGYVERVKPQLGDQRVIARELTEEVDRAREAYRYAMDGYRVAVISSGDPGIYAMAGLVFEVLKEAGWREREGPAVEVVPGVSALQACAARVGAPLMHDFCAVSLSDLLTPRDVIRRRLQAAAAGDFVTALYNPRSKRRVEPIREAKDIFLRYRSGETPVALVRNAYREGEEIRLTVLAQMLSHPVDMLTTVLIGNSHTVFYEGKMLTPRGYRARYPLSVSEKKEGRA